jgi:hypothetical protein
MRKLAATVVEAAEEYGISKQELSALWQSQPLMRSSAMQLMMVDAARYRLAQKDIANARHNPLPPVQRPGVSQPINRGAEAVSAALKTFNASPTPQSAAALLQARRNSR